MNSAQSPDKDDAAATTSGHRYLEHLARYPERIVEARADEGEGFLIRAIRRIGLWSSTKANDDCDCTPPRAGR